MYAKDLSEHEILIKQRRNPGIKHFNDPNAFIECSNTMDGVYENINDYDLSRKKILIVFNDIIADIMTNQKIQALIQELFIRCRKLNISLAFITQSYFAVAKDIGLDITHYLNMKIKNKRKLQNIAINHSADIDYKDFMKSYRECTKELLNFRQLILHYQQVILYDLEKNCLILIKMTLTDELEILHDKIKANQAQYDLGREAAKISALSSKNLLGKYEYLTGEGLGYIPSVLEKTKFEYSPLGISFEKDKAKSGAKSESDFNYDNKYRFYGFYKRFDEIEEMLLDSQYNKIKEFNKLFTNFKNPSPKSPKTQLKK